MPIVHQHFNWHVASLAAATAEVGKRVRAVSLRFRPGVYDPLKWYAPSASTFLDGLGMHAEQRYEASEASAAWSQSGALFAGLSQVTQ
jgi:hypothetical protein